jgi:hypothetical protein
MLFFEYMDGALETLTDLFNQYGTLSGQAINFHKSSLYFSKAIRQEDREYISDFLQIPIGNGTGKYLGMPFVTGRNKRQVFDFIRERVNNGDAHLLQYSHFGSLLSYIEDFNARSNVRGVGTVRRETADPYAETSLQQVRGIREGAQRWVGPYIVKSITKAGSWIWIWTTS